MASQGISQKTKGYLKAFQRSFSLSSLDRNFPPDEEDPTSMTISFLWSQLQSQRAQHRAEKLRADRLSKLVLELQHNVDVVLNPTFIKDASVSMRDVESVGPENMLDFDKICGREHDRFPGSPDESFDGAESEKEANRDESFLRQKPASNTLSRSCTVRRQKPFLSRIHSCPSRGNSYRTKQCSSINNCNHDAAHATEEHDKIVGKGIKTVTHISDEMQKHQVHDHVDGQSFIDMTEMGSDFHESWNSNCARPKSCVPDGTHVSYPNSTMDKTFFLQSSANMEDAHGTIPEMCQVHINDYMPRFNHSIWEQDTVKTCTLKSKKMKSSLGSCSHSVGSCSHQGSHPLYYKLDSVICSHQGKKLNQCICNSTTSMLSLNGAKPLNNVIWKKHCHLNKSPIVTAERASNPATFMSKHPTSIQTGDNCWTLENCRNLPRFVAESPTLNCTPAKAGSV